MTRTRTRLSAEEREEKREELAELLREAKRKPWPRANAERIGFDLIPDDHLDGAAWQDRDYTLAELNERLRHFTVSEVCPLCGSRWSSWTDLHGVAACGRCRCPRQVYLYIRDQRPDAVCRETLGVDRVCGKRKDEHVETPVHWVGEDGSAGTDIELRCPEFEGPGLRGRWNAPTLLRLVRNNLWTNPYSLHLPKR